jgi:hypothetical protein
MNNTNTGGPAFPYEYFDEQLQRARVMHGMTLRDYFAAKAMQGFISDPDWRQDMMPEETARAAYHQADAMLKAREA